MELLFLGRGAAFQPSFGSNSAYYIEGTKLMVIDCGESTFARLHAAGVLQGITELYIALTHLHSDHSGSLGTLCHYCKYVLHLPLQIVVPQEPEYTGKITTLLDIFGAPEGSYQFVLQNEIHFDSFSQLRYIPTEHAKEIPAFSLVFETPSGGIFYSGDTCTADGLVEFVRTHPHFESAYMDSTDADFPGNVHLNVHRLAQVVPETVRHRIRLMHLNGKNVIKIGRALGFETVIIQQERV